LQHLANQSATQHPISTTPIRAVTDIETWNQVATLEDELFSGAKDPSECMAEDRYALLNELKELDTGLMELEMEVE
jgi:hypothetical protein